MHLLLLLVDEIDRKLKVRRREQRLAILAKIDARPMAFRAMDIRRKGEITKCSLNRAERYPERHGAKLRLIGGGEA